MLLYVCWCVCACVFVFVWYVCVSFMDFLNSELVFIWWLFSFWFPFSLFLGTLRRKQVPGLVWITTFSCPSPQDHYACVNQGNGNSSKGTLSISSHLQSSTLFGDRPVGCPKCVVDVVKLGFGLSFGKEAVDAAAPRLHIVHYWQLLMLSAIVLVTDFTGIEKNGSQETYQ